MVVGSLCGIGFALLRNPYAVLLGVLAGVLECIPLIGPLAVTVVAVGIAGIFIAIPLVALVVVVARHWLKWRTLDAEFSQLAQSSPVTETL